MRLWNMSRAGPAGSAMPSGIPCPEAGLKRFAPRDVLFAKLRPYLARVACPPTGGLCVGEFLVLRPRRSAFVTRYVARLLRSRPMVDAVDNLTRGARVPRAEWNSIGQMKIVRPPLPEQNAIVGYLEKTVAWIDESVARATRQIDLVSEYRARLVADVVTGKHDVRGTPVTPLDLAPFAVGGDLDNAPDNAAGPEPDRPDPASRLPRAERRRRLVPRARPVMHRHGCREHSELTGLCTI